MKLTPKQKDKAIKDAIALAEWVIKISYNSTGTSAEYNLHILASAAEDFLYRIKNTYV